MVPPSRMLVCFNKIGGDASCIKKRRGAAPPLEGHNFSLGRRLMSLSTPLPREALHLRLIKGSEHNTLGNGVLAYCYAVRVGTGEGSTFRSYEQGGGGTFLCWEGHT
jgi:hypothetical protein